jgi:hypothetical protein
MLSETNKIDLVSEGEGGQFRLALVVEPGEWKLSDAKRMLQEKLNAYASYALDGEFAAQHPDAKSVHITVMPSDPPPAEMVRFLHRLIDAFRPHIAIDVFPMYQAAA